MEAALPGYQHNVCNGLLAPARTPAAVISEPANEIATVMKTPAVRERFAAYGVESGGNTPQEPDALIHAEIPKWCAVVRQAGIKPE